MELFIAALFFSAGMSAAVFFLLAGRLKRGANAATEDVAELESRVNDLVTHLNHVANTHVDAVADRRDELKRVIDMANASIRKMNTLLADIGIMDRRLRNAPLENTAEAAPAPREPAPEEEEEKIEEVGPVRRFIEVDERSALRRAAFGTEEESFEEENGEIEEDSVPPRQEMTRGGVGVERREKVEERRRLLEDIRLLAEDGLAPELIARRMKRPLGEVEMLLRRAGRELQ